MHAIISKWKNKFYLQNINKRIIIVITILTLLTDIVFVGSAFFMMMRILYNKVKSNNEKDILMINKELDMLFQGIKNDAISVLVSDDCQTLLLNSSDYLKSDSHLQYQKYKLIQTMIMSTIVNRPEYNAIVFYDTNGNSYADDRMMVSEENLETQEDKIRDFIGNKKINEKVVSLHKSAWKQKKDPDFKNCLSYVRKVYSKNQGQLIGVVELEIVDTAISDLFTPVMQNGSSIHIENENTIISSSNQKLLYHDLSGDKWFNKLKQYDSIYSFFSSEDRKNIYFMQPYEQLNWRIIDAVPKAIYMKDIIQYAFIDILIGILLFLGSLYISRILITSITKPLSKITDTIVEISEGDYRRRVHVKDGGEIKILADEFNRMIDKTNLLMKQMVEKEREKREAALSLSQMQMTPHFLYNILENICGLIVLDDKKTAIHVINLLSAFYRGVLNKGKEIISISAELNIAVNYLEIMKICKPDQFQYYIDVPEEIKNCSISKLTFQPILENSIHHGFSRMTSGGIIRITGEKDGKNIRIEITDNGRGIQTDYLENKDIKNAFHMESYGLKNTDDRIKMYFGDSYGIRIAEQKTGTRIQITLPETIYSIPGASEDLRGQNV